RSRPPVPSYTCNSLTRGRCQLSDCSRHSRQHGGDRAKALREVVEGPSGQYRPPHDGPLSHYRRYKPSHTPVTRKNGGRKLMTPKEIFWCGEGDLNPQPTPGICKLLISRSVRRSRTAKKAGCGHNLGTTPWGEPLR